MTQWVIHDERHQHLPELSNICVPCLQAEIKELRDNQQSVAARFRIAPPIVQAESGGDLGRCSRHLGARHAQRPECDGWEREAI